MTEIKSRAGENGKKKRSLWLRVGFVMGIVLLVLFVVLIVSALFAPAVGNVFDNIVASTGNLSESSDFGAGRYMAVDIPLRLIIREGHITLIVEDTLVTKDAIEDLVGEMEIEGAFIISSEERGGYDNQMPSVNMVIRVPAERFDDVMDHLSGLAIRVEERSETAEDVTEEYVDLDGRLTSMKAARDRLRSIMDDANTVEELLLAEQQLAEREAEIEALQGRLEYLTQSAQLSRIEITLRPSEASQTIADSFRPGETLSKAFKGLVKSFYGAVDFIIYFGIVVLPWLIVIGLVIYGLRRLLQRYRSVNDSEEAEGRSSKEK